MFKWKSAAGDRHRGVHAGRVIFERCSYIRRRSLPFALSGQSKSEREETLIDRDGHLAKQLGKPPRCGTPVQLHLPQTVAPLKVSDRPPRISVRSGKDMRHGKLIEPHSDRRVQAT